MNFRASSTTGIFIYSGTITGKIVLSLDGSMKDLFFVRLHTLILCPNFLDAQKGRAQNLKKMLRVTIVPNLPELDVH